MSPSIEFLADAEHRLLHGIRSRTDTELLGFLAPLAVSIGSRIGANRADADAVDCVGRLAGAVDALLRTRAAEDAEYFQHLCVRGFNRSELAAIAAELLQAYRQRCASMGNRAQSAARH